MDRWDTNDRRGKVRVTTKSNSLGLADLSSVNFGAWLVESTWCGPALPGFSGAVHAENPDVFYRRNHREVGCVIDCLHKHKLTVSHADNQLFHLTIVSNRFPPIPLCSGWSAHLRLQLDSTNCRLYKCRSQGRSAFRVVRRPPSAVDGLFDAGHDSRHLLSRLRFNDILVGLNAT